MRLKGLESMSQEKRQKQLVGELTGAVSDPRGTNGPSYVISLYTHNTQYTQ